MKISTFKFTQRTNLGNFEHLEVTAEATIEEDDNPAEAVGRFRIFVDWFSHIDERQKKYNQFIKELEAGGISEAQSEKIQKWVDEFETKRAIVEAM